MQPAQQSPEQSAEQPEPPPHRFKPGVCPNPYGRGAPAARARQDEAERQREEERLLADLGCTPSAAQRILVEEVAGLVVRARRLRAQGRPDDDQARLIARLLRQLGVRPGPARPQLTGPAALAAWLAGADDAANAPQMPAQPSPPPAGSEATANKSCADDPSLSPGEAVPGDMS